eukprot:Nitzschia sp. Nitz4//scaffold158_size52425//10750//11412//NITZ4_006853-RA/size52425-processed-gene-0.47-mRNA-1//-1//CDS//3329537495//7343//frame0
MPGSASETEFDQNPEETCADSDHDDPWPTVPSVLDGKPLPIATPAGKVKSNEDKIEDHNQVITKQCNNQAKDDPLPNARSVEAPALPVPTTLLGHHDIRVDERDASSKNAPPLGEDSPLKPPTKKLLGGVAAASSSDKELYIVDDSCNQRHMQECDGKDEKLLSNNNHETHSLGQTSPLNDKGQHVNERCVDEEEENVSDTESEDSLPMMKRRKLGAKGF